MRIGHFSRRTFFQWMLAATALLAAPGLLMAQGNGKGGGKDDGGGDEPSTPPPVMYQIFRIENFHVAKVNHDTDLLGKLDTADSQAFAIVYKGDSYPVAEFFVGLDVTLRTTYGLSDRAEDGSIHLTGTCNAADGIRGWVMRLTPGLDGALEPTNFSLAQPAEGDDITLLRNVNRSGEAVGYSRFSGGGDRTAIYHTMAGITYPIASPLIGLNFITNSGDWVGTIGQDDGRKSVYTWKPGGEPQFLLDADGPFPVRDINSTRHIIGHQIIYETSKKGSTTSSVWNYFFDGNLSLLNVRESSSAGPFVEGLNDFDDILFARTVINGGPNTPNYDSGSIYFAALDREFMIDDMIALDNLYNTDENLALWFDSNDKQFVDVTNSGLIVGSIPPSSSGLEYTTTFLLVPVQP